MIDGREKVRYSLLLHALGDPVDLSNIDWHVRQQNPSATLSEVQIETLAVIRSLVSDGLFRLRGEVVLGERPGAEATEGERFAGRSTSLNHSLHKISLAYLRHYANPEKWMYSAFLELTDTGEQLARSLERTNADSYRQFE